MKKERKEKALEQQKALLAQELFDLTLEKEKLCSREEQVKVTLDKMMVNGETVTVNMGMHYLTKIISDTPVLTDSKTIMKEIGLSAFLRIAKASVKKLRELVGEEKLVADFVLRYKKSTGFKFYETHDQNGN
jgi:hypothetical protein